MAFERVTIDPDRMGGVPCIRDLRVPVATVAAMVADGMIGDKILADLPYLEAEDVAEAVAFQAVHGARVLIHPIASTVYQAA